MPQADAPAPVLRTNVSDFEPMSAQAPIKELSQSLAMAARIYLFFLTRIGREGS